MRIAFLTLEHGALGPGGIGVSVDFLSTALARQGHDIEVVGWRGEAVDRAVDGVRVRFLPSTRVPRLGWLLNRRRVARWLRREHERRPFDAILAHDWCGPAAGMRLPVAAHVLCHGSATYFADELDGSVRPTVRLAEAWSLRSARAVAGVSRYVAERTRELFGLRREVAWVPNGVDIERFRPPPSDERHADEILYFGTIVRKKGLLELAAAFSKVVERRPAASLVLIGPDSPDVVTGSPSTWELCRERLSAAAARRVDYRGPMPHGEIRRALRRAGFCMLPSRAEALPLAWMEALASGCPVVGFDRPWAHDLVEDGVHGRLVADGDVDELAQAAVSLLDSPEESARLGARAADHMASHFDLRLVARRVEEWLRGAELP